MMTMTTTRMAMMMIEVEIKPSLKISPQGNTGCPQCPFQDILGQKAYKPCRCHVISTILVFLSDDRIYVPCPIGLNFFMVIQSLRKGDIISMLGLICHLLSWRVNYIKSPFRIWSDPKTWLPSGRISEWIFYRTQVWSFPCTLTHSCVWDLKRGSGGADPVSDDKWSLSEEGH